MTADAGLVCEDTTPLVRPSFFGPCDDLFTGLVWGGCTATATTAHNDEACSTRACIVTEAECVEAAIGDARDCAACHQCPSAVIERNAQIACVATYRTCVQAAANQAEMGTCRQDYGRCLPAPGLPLGCPA